MKSNKGFSMVELFAIIIVTTTVLIPLLFSLIGNFEVNVRLHNRKAASLIGVSAIQGFETITFNHINNLLIDNPDHYIKFDKNNCTELDDVLGVYKTSKEICDYVFDQKVSNTGFEADQFMVFIYPFRLTEDVKNDLLADPDIPVEVKAEIEAIPTSNVTTSGVLRISVWIRYDERATDVIVRNGVVTRE